MDSTAGELPSITDPPKAHPHIVIALLAAPYSLSLPTRQGGWAAAAMGTIPYFGMGLEVGLAGP
jgi:hypothetical protein